MADVVPTVKGLKGCHYTTNSIFFSFLVLFSFEIAQTWSIYTIPDSGLKAPSTGHYRGGIPPEQNAAVLNDSAKVRQFTHIGNPFMRVAVSIALHNLSARIFTDAGYS